MGDQLGRPEGLQGSTSAVVIGSITALYGVIGLGQAAHNAINVCWAIPRNSRLNPVLSRIRSLGWMVVGGLALAFVAVLTSVSSHLEVIESGFNGVVHWLVVAATVVVTTCVLAVMIRWSKAESDRFRDVLPGAAVTAVPDEAKGERLVVLHLPLDKDADQIRRELQSAGLPNLFIPARDSFCQVEAIPVLGSGKLDLKAVKRLALEKFAAK